jgi:hypothetical protein
VARNVTGGTVMARVFRAFNQQYYSAVDTPKGELLTSRYYDLDSPHEPVKPISHSNDVPLSEIDPTAVYQSQPVNTTRPAAPSGAVVRSQKGITEYNWSSNQN